MKKFGIDFTAIATKAAGHAVGAAAYTQLNKAKFMQNFSPSKQALKGLVTAAIGYIAAPMLAKQAGLAGKGNKGAFVESIGEGLGIVGVMIAANALIKPQAGSPALFPVISGVEGMEENGIEGVLYEEGIEGITYETDPTLAGAEHGEAV